MSIHRMGGAVHGTMNVMGLQSRVLVSNGFNHAHHRRQAHAAGEQHHRPQWYFGQEEVAGWRRRFQDVTDFDFIMQEPRSALAIRLPLNRNPVGV